MLTADHKMPSLPPERTDFRRYDHGHGAVSPELGRIGGRPPA